MLKNRYEVCIVGGGIAGGLIAYSLTKRGMSVAIVEAGSRFELGDRLKQLKRRQILGEPLWPWVRADRDVFTDSSSASLGYNYPLNDLRVKGVGGSTLHWGGLAQRLRESDFATFTTYGMGVDWPISYAELEPYYCLAETELGVSGIQNPGDPPRSRPFPLPPFETGHDEKYWFPVAEKLGITIDSVSQGRTSRPYRGRSPCVAYAVCNLCPSGARYSGDIHVRLAEQTGLCDVFSETVARRIQLDGSGNVSGLNATSLAGRDIEISATTYVVAAHAIESARLLMLSKIGNHSDQVGRNLMEHWYVGAGGTQSAHRLSPGRIGFGTIECNSFYDGAERRERGAIKIEFGTSPHETLKPNIREGLWGKKLAQYDCENFGRWLSAGAEVEHQPNPNSRVTLDPIVKDQFGDPAPHLHFEVTDTDRKTQRAALDIVNMLLDARGVSDIKITSELNPGAHHLGTLRMSEDPNAGVVDSQCRVHGVENLFVAGSSVFPTGGARQPTLTIAALALRLANHLSDKSEN